MKKLMTAALAIFAGAYAWAVDTTQVTIKVGGVDTPFTIPKDIAGIVNSNMGNIESALDKAGVNSSQIQSALDTVNDKYDDFMDEYGISNPYNTVVDGVGDFCDNLCDTIPNTQTLQNLWAQSWIGYLIPGVHFGLGVNAGVAMLDIEPLINVAEALTMDVGDLPDKLVFPTATLDARIGGFILPFDIGFTFSTIDTSDIGALDDAIDPCCFEYFSIGGDLRYRLVDAGSKLFNARVSASLGGYFTKGSVNVEDCGSSVDMDFKSTTLFVGAQASAKALCFVPFLGGRLALTKTKVEWDANADWNEILGDDSDISDVMSWGILPTHFGDDSDSGWKVRPQIYGGIGFDLFVVDLTISGSYDFVSGIPGGAVSLRLSI